MQTKSFDYLTDNEKKALLELKEIINKKYPGSELIIYGSKSRGDFNKNSDVDVLILIDGTVGKELKERYINIAGEKIIKNTDVVYEIKENIYSMNYEIELKYGIPISTLIKPKNNWYNDGLLIAEPIHQNIDRDGIKI